MVHRAGDPQEECFAESHLKGKHPYGTIFTGANTCPPVRVIKLDSAGAEC